MVFFVMERLNVPTQSALRAAHSAQDPTKDEL